MIVAALVICCASTSERNITAVRADRSAVRLVADRTEKPNALRFGECVDRYNLLLRKSAPLNRAVVELAADMLASNAKLISNETRL